MVEFPDTVAQCSTAERWVYREIRLAEGPLTVLDLAQRTGLSNRCIRAATEELIDHGVIEAGFETESPRRKIFDTTQG